jgi:hypothetical protein
MSNINGWIWYLAAIYSFKDKKMLKLSFQFQTDRYLLENGILDEGDLWIDLSRVNIAFAINYRTTRPENSYSGKIASEAFENK